MQCVYNNFDGYWLIRVDMYIRCLAQAFPSDIIGLDKKNPFCPKCIQNSSISSYKLYGLGLTANEISAGEAPKSLIKLA